MKILWHLWRGFPGLTFVSLKTISIWLEYFPQVSARPRYISRSVDSLWNAVRGGNSTSCLQSWTVCSALLLPCCMTRSLHPFISLCLSFLICNIGIINYMAYTYCTTTYCAPSIYCIYNNMALKATQKFWGSITAIRFKLCYKPVA